MQAIPKDLGKILKANLKAKAKWDNLTPIGRRDFITWIESAKHQETRKRRIESVPSRLASGKKRPCCFAIVPMSLYKEIGESPKAKATWKDLSPDHKRDFVDWIDTAEKSKRPMRIAKVSALLAKGQRHP